MIWYVIMDTYNDIIECVSEKEFPGYRLPSHWHGGDMTVLVLRPDGTKEESPGLVKELLANKKTEEEEDDV
ncbi:MAG: hypothetical protein A3J76_05915 [Candidatus Moranbacteria bacterium RBG_13_45_13]|nr:MAG: hypothetical protein A3J76_05915 [Candidatus Moranbacteria bacterium RBG_13_45_13]